jgi:hypothetical protein
MLQAHACTRSSGVTLHKQQYPTTGVTASFGHRHPCTGMENAAQMNSSVEQQGKQSRDTPYLGKTA